MFFGLADIIFKIPGFQDFGEYIKETLWAQTYRKDFEMKDVFLKCHDVKVLKTNKAITGKGFLLDTGSKVEVDDIILETGGGGTNTVLGGT